MTGDPAEEAEVRRQKRGLEAAARAGKLPDPAHVLRIHRGGVHRYVLARWSTCARLVSDAADAGTPREAADLGTVPWPPPAPDILLTIGIKGPDGAWLVITEGYEELARAVADMERGLS